MSSIPDRISGRHSGFCQKATAAEMGLQEYFWIEFILRIECWGLGVKSDTPLSINIHIMNYTVFHINK